MGSIGIKFIGLILLPVYTDKLTPDQYGMWSLLEISSQLLLMAVGLRLSTAMLRFYSSEKESKGRSGIIFTAFLATLLSVVVFNLLSQPFVARFSSLFFDTVDFQNYFVLLFIWISFETFNLLVLDLIRVKEKPGLYITVTLTKFTLVLLITIYLVKFRDMGIEGIILGQLGGSILLLLITMPFVVREMRWHIDFKVFRAMLNYGVPLIFSGIASFVLAMGDRYLIKIFLDYHEVGVYSISYKISNVIKIVFVQAFQLGFLPIAFNLYNKPDAKRFFIKIFTYYVFVIFWSGLALSVFSKEIIYNFTSGEAYYEAYKYIPFLTLAICFYGIQSFFLIGIHYAKKTKVIALITIGVLVANIGLNVLVIPRYGLYGSSVTYILSGLLMAIINYYQSQRYYPLNYEMKKTITIILLSVGLYLVSLLLNDSVIWLRLTIKTVLIMLFPFLLYLLKFYEAVEVEKITGLWRKWRNPKYWYRNLKEIAVKQAIDTSEV